MLQSTGPGLGPDSIPFSTTSRPVSADSWRNIKYLCTIVYLVGSVVLVRPVLYAVAKNNAEALAPVIKD